MKEITMTTNAMMSKNGRVPRKSLADQINRLDEILDGLGQALNESVAAAVRQVVRETVEVSVREVLSNPELLRTALAQQGPPESGPQEVPPAPPRKLPGQARSSVWGRLYAALGSVWTKASEQAQHVAGCMSVGWRWCLRKIAQGCSRAINLCRLLKVRVVGAALTTGAVLYKVWQFRRSGSLALSVGLLSAIGSYLAGPAVGSLLCGLAGVALTLAGLVLIPLGRLLFTNDASFA